DPAEAGLPIQNLVAQFLIRFMRRRALELADEVTDQDGRRNTNGEVDMSLDPADLVNVDTGRVDATAAKVVMDDGLDLRHEERGVFLGVRGDVQVDLGVEVAGHGVAAVVGARG